MSASRSRRARTAKNSSRSPRLLRGEQLEARTVLTAIGPLSHLHLLALPPGGNAGVYAKVTPNTPPTVTNAAAAILSTSGTTASLSVLGNDAQGASTLVYTWTITSTPAGGSAKFSVNGSNAAQNDTVTFTEAGVYGISVSIVDKSGLSVTSSVKVTVAQTLTSISLCNGGTKTVVSPAAALKVTGTSQTLTAVALDQFGNALATQPPFTWATPTCPSGAKTNACRQRQRHGSRHFLQGWILRRHCLGCQRQHRAGGGHGQHLGRRPADRLCDHPGQQHDPLLDFDPARRRPVPGPIPEPAA